MPKVTKLQRQRRQEYAKEVARIRRQQRRMEARGYVFQQPVVPATRPDRVTKRDVDRLKKLTTTALYEKALYADPATGEAVSGIAGRSLERSAAALRAADTRRRNQESYIHYVTEETPEEYRSDKIADPYMITEEELKRELQDASQLKKYGGWIEDQKTYQKRNGVMREYGGSYIQHVDDVIRSLLSKYRGMSVYQKRVFTQLITSVVDANRYQYESIAVRLNTQEAFDGAKYNFDAFASEIENAMTVALRSED